MTFPAGVVVFSLPSLDGVIGTKFSVDIIRRTNMMINDTTTMTRTYLASVHSSPFSDEEFFAA
jgi:hypothetical protein